MQCQSKETACISILAESPGRVVSRLISGLFPTSPAAPLHCFFRVASPIRGVGAVVDFGSFAMSADSTTFVYGTLLYPENLRVLLGRVPPIVPAEVSGFARFSIADEQYPGVIRAGPESSVRGALLTGLSADEMDLLDAFEGDEYERVVVEATPVAGGDPAKTGVYLFKRTEALTQAPWDPEAFRGAHLEEWTSSCVAWKEEYLRTKAKRTTKA